MKESIFLKFKLLFPFKDTSKDIKNSIYKIEKGLFSDTLDMYHCLFDCCSLCYKTDKNQIIKKIWDNLPLKLIYYDGIYTKEDSVDNLLLKIKTFSILLQIRNNNNLYENKVLESVYYLHWCKMQLLLKNIDTVEIRSLREISFLVFNGCFSGKSEVEKKLKSKLIKYLPSVSNPVEFVK